MCDYRFTATGIQRSFVSMVSGVFVFLLFVNPAVIILRATDLNSWFSTNVFFPPFFLV